MPIVRFVIDHGAKKGSKTTNAQFVDTFPPQVGNLCSQTYTRGKKNLPSLYTLAKKKKKIPSQAKVAKRSQSLQQLKS